MELLKANARQEELALKVGMLAAASGYGHGMLSEELALMVEAEPTPMRALSAGTVASTYLSWALASRSRWSPKEVNLLTVAGDRRVDALGNACLVLGRGTEVHPDGAGD
ncbi:MAG: hypothetical protein M3248_02615 [Actinomycetota bacterium]|nr:hypothetical protein [Actinomycetota bacterium]